MAYSLNNFLGTYTSEDKLLKIYNSQGQLDSIVDPFKIVTTISSNNLVILKTRSSSKTLDFSSSVEAKLALEKIQSAITTITTNTSPLFVDRYITNYVTSIGSTGPQGERGNTGFQGSGGTGNGTTGPQGNIGPQGPAGSGTGVSSTGPQGDIGPQGPAGSGTGSTGPQGFQGNTGSQGSTGPQGFQGNTGSQGSTGPQGPGNLVDSLTYSNNTIYLSQQGPTISLVVPFVSSADSSSLEINNYTVSLKETITGNRIFSNNVSIVGSLTVTGTTSNVSVTDLSVQNSTITLVDGFTSGTPIYDAKISVLRGDQQISSIKWNEVTDTWQAGLSGSESTFLLGVGFGLTRSGYTVSLDLLIVGPTGSTGPQGNIGYQGSTGPNSITIDSTSIIGGTSGYLLFEGSGNKVKQSSNLYWDETNNRLGIGTDVPTFNLDVVGKQRITGDGSTYSLEVYSTGNSYIAVYGNSVSSADGYLRITNATDTPGSFVSTLWSRSNVSSYPSAWYLADLSIDTGTIAAMRFESRINEGSQISVRPLFEWRNNTTRNMLMFANGNLMLQNGETFSGITSSILTLNSTTKGFLPPRVTSSEKYNIVSPVSGLFVYDTDLTSYSYFNGTTWSSVGTGAGNGETGPQGAIGPQGSQGISGGGTGNTGSQGPQGNTGPQGNQGVTGNPGSIRTDNVTNQQVTITHSFGYYPMVQALNQNGERIQEADYVITHNSINSFTATFSNWGIGGFTYGTIISGGAGYDFQVENSGDNRILTSNGTATGSVAESNLTFDGGTLTVSATASLQGHTIFAETSEVLNSTPGATATSVIYDFTTGAIWYHATASTNYSANFTNIPTTDNRAITATIIISQGATGYSPTSVRIDGVTQSVKWSSGTYSVSTNKVDIVGFTFIRSGNAWSQVFGQISSFS
jgi:hypothetical protein